MVLCPCPRFVRPFVHFEMCICGYGFGGMIGYLRFLLCSLLRLGWQVEVIPPEISYNSLFVGWTRRLSLRNVFCYKSLLYVFFFATVLQVCFLLSTYFKKNFLITGSCCGSWIQLYYNNRGDTPYSWTRAKLSAEWDNDVVASKCCRDRLPDDCSRLHAWTLSKRCQKNLGRGSWSST